MSEVDYNLKESQKAVGQLRPAILAKDGWVVDGLHRLEADPEWKTETHEDIDTEEKKWIARSHANLARRTMGREEKREIINNLAKIYEEQGLKVEYHPPERGGPPRNQIFTKIAEVLKGCMGEETIRGLIDPKYKQKPPEALIEHIEERRRETLAIERLKADKYTVEKRYGPGFVEKLEEEVKEEVREELKQDTGFRDDIKKEVEQKLRTDPEFILDAAESAADVLPTLTPREVTREGYHKPTLTEQQKEQIVEAAERVEARKKERLQDPRLLKIGRLNRIATALLSVANVLYLVECPITGNSAETDLIFKESGLTIEEARTEVRRQLEELRRVGSHLRTKSA